MHVCVFGSVYVRVHAICRVGCSRCCLVQDTKAYSTARYTKLFFLSFYRRAESELAERRRKSGMIEEDDGDEYSDDDKDAL